MGVLVVFFCLVNVIIITHLPYLTNATSCKLIQWPLLILPQSIPLECVLFATGSSIRCHKGWWDCLPDGSRCGRMIRIKARNGMSTVWLRWWTSVTPFMAVHARPTLLMRPKLCGKTWDSIPIMLSTSHLDHGLNSSIISSQLMMIQINNYE
ncbi:hypothetical protein AAZX31_20G185900 [Glycine max]